MPAAGNAGDFRIWEGRVSGSVSRSDGERLAEIIGQRQAMVCAIFLPEEEEVPVDRETMDA